MPTPSNGGLLKRARRAYQQFKRDAPGERFLDLYKRRREKSKGPAATVISVLAGIVLIVGGFVLGFIPGVPGIVLAALGVALIAMRFRRAAVWLDWAELQARKLWRRFRASRN